MIHVNANADLIASAKINTQELNDLLRNLNKPEETLYVTFYARKEDFKPKVSKGKDGSFLNVILPFDEVICSNDPLPLLLTHLTQNIARLKWLDHTSLKEKIESVLEAQSTPEAKVQRLERAAKWEANCQIQYDHIQRVLKEGANFSVFHKEPEDYPDLPIEEENE